MFAYLHKKIIQMIHRINPIIINKLMCFWSSALVVYSLIFWEDNEAYCFTFTQHPHIMLVWPELSWPERCATTNTWKLDRASLTPSFLVRCLVMFEHNLCSSLRRFFILNSNWTLILSCSWVKIYQLSHIINHKTCPEEIFTGVLMFKLI